MSKSIFSEFGGALTLTETSGVLTLAWDESLGGGAAAGIVKGQGSLVLSGTLGLQLAEKLLNAHLSGTALALATAGETVANAAVAAIE